MSKWWVGLKWNDWIMLIAVTVFLLIAFAVAGEIRPQAFRWLVFACDGAAVIYWIAEIPQRSSNHDIRLAAVVPILICVGSIIVISKI